MFTSRLLLVPLSFGLAVFFVGCSSKTDKETKQTTPQSTQTNKASAATASEEPSGLAELSAEDRELAKIQRICPVSGDVLGAMGKPFKTTIQGKTVFLCCEGCEQDLKDNPDKYLAKLKEPEKNK
jgi:YHS domain-containing protein